jgi:DNA polymerase I
MQLEHPCLFLVDGAALAYRSHFAFIRSPLITGWGQNVSALFGFTHAILRLLREAKPDFVAVVQDPPGPTFRHELYAEYKATRQKMPDDLRSQWPLLEELTEALGVLTVQKEGYEADDVIGTLARRAQEQGIHTYIVSGDKDMAQLVSGKVSIYNIAKPDVPVELMGPDEVRAKFEVPPERIVDLLALQGDSSDNIPGIAGVGPKAAVKLLAEYASIDELIEKRDSVKLKKAREALQADPGVVLMSRKLATIHTDVPVDARIDELGPREPDRIRLRELFQRYEFRSLLKEFTDDHQTDDHEYVLLRTPAELRARLPELRSAPLLVVDTETTSLNPFDARLVGVSLSVKPREAFYVPLESQGEGETDTELLGLLRPLLEDESLPKAGQNVKYDLMVLENHGITLRGIVLDTMIASFLVEPGARQHNLDFLALTHLGFKKIATTQLLGKKGKGQLSMLDVDVETVGNYACEDADITLRLAEKLWPRVDELGLGRLMADIELPLIPVLADMERTGVKLDVPFLEALSAQMRTEADALRQEIVRLCEGRAFNLDSPKQLGQVLFDELAIHKDLGRRAPKKTKTGAFTTDARTLESFSAHPVIRKILDYRQLQKLIGTYVDALPKLVRPDTGRVHTSFNQTIAITGRLSSTDPNLQNIPIRTEMGREIRKAFIPGGKGQVLLSADYSQIELRIMAHFSGDENLIGAFEAGEDIHRRTAALVFGVEPAKVTREMRDRAKTINFGILYGMNEYGLASRLGITNEQAKQFIESYFEKLPKVKQYLDGTIELTRAQGFVSTILGRRRDLPEIHAKDFAVRKAAENMAVNTPLQGSAADLIKKAMIALHAKLPQAAPSARMLLQVHDELVFEVNEGELAAASELIRREMEGAFSLRVPLSVDIGHGKNWLEAH